MSPTLAMLVALAGTLATPDLGNRPEPWSHPDWCPAGTRRVKQSVENLARLTDGAASGRGPAYACVVEGSRTKKEGPFVAFHKSVNWHLAAQGSYRADKAEGRWSYFDFEGRTVDEGEYRLGLKHGRWRRSKPETGDTRWEVDYLEGRRHGEYREYRCDGSIKEQGRFERDFRAGSWTYFWPNGRPSAVGPFLDGAEHGLWRFYDAAGREITSTRMERGTGRWVELWPNGTKHGEGRRVQGLRHGPWTYWHENGAVREKLRYHRGGCRRGPYQRWHPDGTLAVSGQYASTCHKTGRWLFWDADGAFSKGICYRRSDERWTSQDELVVLRRRCRTAAAGG